jgi:hypothetical protein
METGCDPQITQMPEDSRISSPGARRNLCESVKSVDDTSFPVETIDNEL